jgi:hypothetical protein
MMTSIDGKIMETYMETPEGEAAYKEFYNITISMADMVKSSKEHADRVVELVNSLSDKNGGIMMSKTLVALATGMQVAIPPKKNRKEKREYDTYLYKLRHFHGGAENIV